MGIKTLFNPMGGRPSDKGSLSEWYYSTSSGQTPGITLKVYAGFKTDVFAPKKNTIFQDYVNDRATNILQFNATDTNTYTPSSFSSLPIPDHIITDKLSTSQYVTVTNPSGTVNYNTSSDPKDKPKILLPKDWTSVTTKAAGNFVRMYFRSPFSEANTVVNVDLQGVSWYNSSMFNAFYGCSNLRYINGINSSITNVSRAFYGCYNLNQNIQIPSSITNVAYTFSECSNLNQNIQIPSSVSNMYDTFAGCSSLNQNIQIPSSVTNVDSTFARCYALNQNIKIPSTIVSMNSTFLDCSSLNQNIQIPSSAISMYSTFSGCSSLNQNIQIPSSVTNMYGTFSKCSSLNKSIQIPSSVTFLLYTFNGCTALASRINILAFNVTTANMCFNNTSAQKDVWIPYRYINNTLSATRNAFNTAGYIVGTGVGNATNNGCVMHDWVAGQGYPTYVGNGTHWRLAKWTNSSGLSGVVVPNTILGYPVAITEACFASNQSITQLDLNNVKLTNGDGAFEECHYLTTIKNFSQSEATSYQSLFYNCRNLQSITMNSSMLERTAHPYMPNTATTARAMYGHCKNITNFYIDSFGVTTLYRCWNGCNTRNINVYISSPNVSNIAGVFYGYVNSYYKNIYIYFKYANGVNTKTYNAFNGSAFYRNNSTTHCYLYNLGTCPV